MKKTMALDLGDARIGVALSDMLGIIANGYETYHRISLEKDLEHIASIVKDFAVTTVVLGLPINMDGTSGDRVDKTKIFAEQLATKLGDVKIDYQDERLTTVTGERMLIDAGVRRDKRKLVIDKIASTIILQTYLDRH